jgi:hypothetical protein
MSTLITVVWVALVVVVLWDGHRSRKVTTAATEAQKEATKGRSVVGPARQYTFTVGFGFADPDTGQTVLEGQQVFKTTIIDEVQDPPDEESSEEPLPELDAPFKDLEDIQRYLSRM